MFRRVTAWLVAISLFAGATVVLWSVARGRPQDLPWTPLDLSQDVGSLTGRKLAGLGGDPAACRALLDRAGVAYVALPPRRDGPRCGYADGVRLGRHGAESIRYAPAGLGTSCPVAVALMLWEWQVVTPAARRHFGTTVRQVDHFGSYACRRLYGRDGGNWSEHAAANALDIAGFRLSDGTSVTVVRDWNDTGAKGAFLRDMRDGACRLFSTVLSPDYNAAHRDHLHLDQAARGAGWRACR